MNEDLAMTDNASTPTDTPQSGTPSDANGATGGPTSLPLVINAQYVKDLSFENPNAPQSLMHLDKAPEVNVNVDVRARGLADRTFEVELSIAAEAKRDDTTVFMTELLYAGVFTLGQVPEEVVRPLLLIEGPRLLFPFARAIIAETSRDGGFPPLLINPIDFTDLFRRKVEEQGNAGGQAEGEEKKEEA